MAEKSDYKNLISPDEYDLIQEDLKITGHVTTAAGMLISLRRSGEANTVRLKEIYEKALAYDPEAEDHKKYADMYTTVYNYLLEKAEKFDIKVEQDY